MLFYICYNIVLDLFYKQNLQFVLGFHIYTYNVVKMKPKLKLFVDT